MIKIHLQISDSRNLEQVRPSIDFGTLVYWTWSGVGNSWNQFTQFSLISQHYKYQWKQYSVTCASNFKWHRMCIQSDTEYQPQSLTGDTLSLTCTIRLFPFIRRILDNSRSFSILTSTLHQVRKLQTWSV